MAQFGMGGMGGMPDNKPKAVKSDVQYITCQICEAMMKQASRTVAAMREGLVGKQKLDESEILDKLETMCDQEKPNGKWITHYDMVEQGDAIKLVDKKQPSKCNVECATMARACEQVLDQLDLTDLSEALFAGKGRAQLNQLACYDMSGVCKRKPPSVPKDRAPGPEHVGMSEEEARMDEMMAKMKAAGMGGQMYDKDSLKAQMEQMEGLEGLQAQADAGEFNTVELTEAGSPSGAAAAALEQAKEVAGNVAEKAGEVLGKASGFVKGLWSKVAGSEQQEAEL